jgi:preprotein translocase subunit SecE
MATQGGSTTANFWRTLFQVGLYKRSQGRLVRRTTFWALAITVVLGAWSMSNFLRSRAEPAVQYGAVSLMIAGGAWICFRVVNQPQFAEFLISVESEVAKVSWPTWRELRRSSTVVIMTMFGLAAVLFFYDILWQRVLQLFGVLTGGKG